VKEEDLKRGILLKSREDYWHELKIKGKVKFGPSLPFDVYVGKLMRTKLNFCPPEVGHIIHKVYENMAIGIPSLIPKSSYNLPSPLDLSDIGIVYDGEVDFKEKYRRFVEKNEFKEIHERCIDLYEKYLTPKNIVSDIIAKTERYL
jgi:hypothetical protein